jgi:hypothetical protein
LAPEVIFLSGDFRSDLIPATSFFARLSLTAIFYSSILVVCTTVFPSCIAVFEALDKQKSQLK